MKQLFIAVIFVFISIAGNAQKSKITIMPENADVTLNGKLVGNTVKLSDKEPNAFVVGASKGMVTYGEKAEDIIKKGAEVKVSLSKINKPAQGFKSHKIEFAKFIDAAGLSKGGYVYTGYTAYATAGVDLEDPQFIKPMAKLMTEWGFDMVGTNTVFEEKGSSPDLVLAGEVSSFGKDTRGSGYQVSVIVNWSLYDTDTKKVTYTSTTGGFSDSKRTLKFNEELSLALKDALTGLMSDAKFQAIATEKAETLSGGKTGGVAVSLPKVTPVAYKGYSDMIKNVLGSVVTIKTDGGFGSGFLISKTGYILTNHHVVTGATKIEVIFESGISMEGTLVKSDEGRDVALLKISGSGFKPLALNSDEESSSTGTEVVAIGTPADLKLNQTVTKGIISGKRELEDKRERNWNFIQIDVPVNPGNSGGPLLTNTGEVVGIIARKRMEKGIEGLGFAIPIGEAIDALNIKIQ